jgi:hypothetical protein
MANRRGLFKGLLGGALGAGLAKLAKDEPVDAEPAVEPEPLVREGDLALFEPPPLPLWRYVEAVPAVGYIRTYTTNTTTTPALYFHTVGNRD